VIDAAKGSVVRSPSPILGADLNMFSRRIATFLLGMWIGCCALVDVLALQGDRMATRVLAVPNPDVRTILTTTGDAGPSILLHHLANEQTRANVEGWEVGQLVLALTIIVALVFTDQRKGMAIALCGVMGVLTLIQHYGITPGLNMAGRQADFMAEATAFNLRSRIWSLTQMYGAVEALKLILGGLLASYFFAMESTVKRSKSRKSRAGDEILSVHAK
jgi:hypothetical protein